MHLNSKMTDSADIHEIKRFCLNPPSAYAAGVPRLAESGTTWDGFEMLLIAANHLGHLGGGFNGQSSRQSFEQFSQNTIGPHIPMTSSVILTPDHSEQSYPLNLSKASSETGSNYSSSPDNALIDYSVKENSNTDYDSASSYSLKHSAVNNFDGKGSSMTKRGSSLTNGSTNACFLNNYHSQLDDATNINSSENNADSSISISVSNFDHNALTSFKITNGNLSTNGNIWTNSDLMTNGSSSVNIDKPARSSLKIAQDDSLRIANSSSNWRFTEIGDNFERLMTNGRASTSSSINGNLSHNGSPSTNGVSSINSNATKPVGIGRSASNGNSSPKNGSSTNRKLSIGRRSWTNVQTSTNNSSAIKMAADYDPTVAITNKVADETETAFINTKSAPKNGHTRTNGNLLTNGSLSNSEHNTTLTTYHLPISSGAMSNGNCNSAKKTETFSDPNVVSTKINTISTPKTAPTTPLTAFRDPVLDVMNLYLGMDGATASQGRSLDPNDPTVNGILWRVQEAQRLAQLLPDDPNDVDLYPIVDVLERPGVKPDMDETCSISFNQNLARDQGNGPRRSIMGHMDRIVNNDSARSCRIQHTATAAQVSNDVFVQMKRQKQLTKRWSEELTTLNYLQELMSQMGLQCNTDREDDDDEDDYDEIDEDNEPDFDLNVSDLTGSDVANIKEEIDSDDESQLFIDDSVMNDS